MDLVCAWCSDVLARIVSQGAERREGSDTESFFAFSQTINGRQRGFTIPRPLLNGGYTLSQLVQIEEQMARLGMELLPIDSNHNFH